MKTPVKKVTLALCFIAGLGCTSHAFSEDTIRSVQIESDVNSDELRVQELLDLEVGAAYQPSVLEQGLVRISQSGLFSSVGGVFDKQSGVLKITLKVRPKISSIEFDPPKNKSSRKAHNFIQSDLQSVLLLNVGDAVSAQTLEELRTRIVNRLDQRGYTNSRVVLSLEGSTEKVARILRISVDLGTLTRTSDIHFYGMSEKEVLEFVDILEDKGGALQLILSNIRLRKSTEKKNGYIRLLSEFAYDRVSLEEALNAWSLKQRERGYFDLTHSVRFSDSVSENNPIEFRVDKGHSYKIRFQGNVAFWERELKSIATDRNKRLGVPFNTLGVINQIKALYQSVGFTNPEITVKSQDKKEIRHVEFRIKEGPRYYLGLVTTKGVSDLYKKEVDEAIKKWRMRISDPLKKIYFDENRLKASLVELDSLLKSRGFLNVRILDLTYNLPKMGSQVPIEITLQTGSQYQFNSVVVEGNSILSQDELDEAISVIPGKISDPAEIIYSNKRIAAAYREYGFLEVKVNDDLNSQIDINADTLTVNVRFSVEPGPQIVVGKAITEGHVRTKERVILRELKSSSLKSGGLWSPSGQQNLEENLLELGIFGSIKTEPVGGKVISKAGENSAFDIQEQDIKISVMERPAGSIDFGPGYRTDSGILGFAEFNYRNIGGWNRSIGTRSQISAKLENYQFLEQRYSFTYTEPYLANLDLRFRFNTSYEKDDDIVFRSGQKVDGFNKEEFIAGFGLDKELTRHLHWYHNLYTLELPRIFDRIKEPTKADQTYKIANIGTSLVYDRRNNIFNPTKGFLASSRVEFSSPQIGSDSDAHYFLNRTSASTYFPIATHAVLAMSINYARLWALERSQEVPVSKRLVLGGRSSIRSLSERALRFDTEQVRDQQSIEGKVEYRQPFILDFGVAYFFDFGRIDSFDLGNTGWRKALGFGIRYNTAVGPLSLDLAYNVDQKTNEDLLKLQFTIGSF